MGVKPPKLSGVNFHEIFASKSKSIGKLTASLSFRTSTLRRSFVKTHLIIFVHGFRGQYLDFYALKNFIMLYSKHEVNRVKYEYLLSKCNEDFAFSRIEEMSSRLATEVHEYINERHLTTSIDKITFVGHSMGCVIIRHTVDNDLMQKYTEYLHSFISFNGPHCGTGNLQNVLVGSALKVLSKWKKGSCLDQLSGKDAALARDTFLFKLSKSIGISGFTNILLFSSENDSFISKYSSTITVTDRLKDKNRDHLIQMVKNVNKNLKGRTIVKCVVSFPDPKSAGSSNLIDNISGKYYHIAPLCDVGFMDGFVNLYRRFIT